MDTRHDAPLSDPQPNLHQPDSYAVHLASMGSAGTALASRDIHNQDGLLLVKKGYAIQQDTVKRLLNHKLVQPLETSVTLANAIDGQLLFDDIIAMLRADRESQAVHQVLAMDEALRQQCSNFARFPLLAQKVTVLSARLKGEYAKALFCGWFSLALAIQTGCDESTRQAAFLAGLIHDCGLLHIDPSIVEKAGLYTAEEWRTIQSHTLIADMFLSYVDALPADVRRATREHHERCDGSGYPVGLFGDKLCWLGQLIAVADTVWATSKKPSGRKAQSLPQVITLMKMNTAQHPHNLLTGLYHLCQRAGLMERRIPDAVNAPDKQALLNLEKHLRQRFHRVHQLRTLLPAKESDRTARSAHLKLDRLWFIVAGSGLLSETLSDWLQTVKGREVTSFDLYEVSLMYGELQWQLVQFGRTLELLLKRISGLETSAEDAIRKTATLLSTPLPETPLSEPVAAEARPA